MTRLPGLDASTGSLGQGLAVGVGIALGARMRGLGFQTYVMLGDGETQEGMVWESVMVAARYGLANLTAIVDCNGLQQYGWPATAGGGDRGDRRDPLAGVQLRDALAAFGWRVLEVDGHDIEAIVAVCADARAGTRPAGRRRSWPRRSRDAACRSSRTASSGTRGWRPPTRWRRQPWSSRPRIRRTRRTRRTPRTRRAP
jgi:transketolase